MAVEWSLQFLIAVAIVLNLSHEALSRGLTLNCQNVGCGDHGECTADGTCACDRGWQGDQCEFCGGRVSLNSSSEFITDCLGNYTIDLHSSKCSDVNSCEKCLRINNCGWCDDGGKTGIGKCMEGGSSNPVRIRDDIIEGSDKCLTGWHFNTCPRCQCNGHSICRVRGDKCYQPCQNNTVGRNCEQCAEGYFGTPTNGGSCSPCQCNGHGTSCEPDTGKCHCTTKGIIGNNCERCDQANMYAGNPADNGTCFYKLAIDYQFTFNLSKPQDRYYTRINFVQTPLKSAVDTDFTMSCKAHASVDVTVKTAYKPEYALFTNRSCNGFKHTFSHKEYSFGTEWNTTFHVYVYNFHAPTWIQVAFSQYPKLNLQDFVRKRLAVAKQVNADDAVRTLQKIEEMLSKSVKNGQIDPDAKLSIQQVNELVASILDKASGYKSLEEMFMAMERDAQQKKVGALKLGGKVENEALTKDKNVT